MNRRSYVYATMAGTVLFAWQLINVAIPRLSHLSPKSRALAKQALDGIGESPTALGWIGAYLLLGLLCHIAPLWLGTRIFLDLKKAGPQPVRELLSRRGSHTLILAGIVLTMVLWSRVLFPSSYAFQDSDLIVNQAASPLLVFGLPAALAALGLIWLLRAANKAAVIASTATLSLMAGLGYLELYAPLPSRTDPGKPDLIVIGVDSLRPDHLKAFGYPGESFTPTIDRLLANSVSFEQAYTPQARTFVAYMGILTGRYPTRNKARENLYPRNQFERSATLPHRLRSDGYTTLFAIDEARFANFDSSFGFDHLAMPGVGSLDFLVGSVYDTVGTNLFQLLPFSYKLMPHVAGNRGASATYRADVFSRNVRTEFRGLDTRRPLLAYFHFCAAHIPFIYDGQREPDLPSPYHDSPKRYRRALRLADTQIGHLVDDLKEAGRLENTVLVLLSDHGEALGMAKDDLTMRDVPAMPVRQRMHGHGTFAADESQTRVLLAFARYRGGIPQWSRTVVSAPASLVDIAPTLLAILGIQPQESEFDGIALLSRAGVPRIPADRTIFVESGISGTSLQTSKVDDQKVANEFSYLYRIADDLRYELDPKELDGQLRQKQRAVIAGRTLLASWPREDQMKVPDCWQVVDLPSKTGRCEPRGSMDPQVVTLRPLICDHFQNDRAFSDRWCLATGPGSAGTGGR